MAARIVVAGAGSVGLAFAIGAARLANTEVTVLERQTLISTAISDQFDVRVYALSGGSKSFLESIGVWQKMDSARIEAVRSMAVWGDDISADSRVNFEEGTPLAWIVEHAALMNALIDVARSSALIIKDQITIAALTLNDDVHTIKCADGTSFLADLVVAADGARSQLRALAALDADIHDYAHDGVVANFKAEKPHDGVARQWFERDSVLAYLPLPDRQISIVWSVAHERAEELAALDREALVKAVALGGRHAVGALKLVSPVARFPLQRVLAHHWVRPGFALIGDAAHAVHPMAGQGANLGFADVATLLRVLRERSVLSGVGDLAVLRRYERARREDAATMGAATHGLHLLYRAEGHWLKRLRNQGLDIVNRLPIVKSLLTDHAAR